VSRRVAFRRAARAEYARAVRWYNRQRPGLGDEFEAEVEAALSAVANQPELYPTAGGDVRVAPVHRFPYAVYYRVRSDLVVVIAVFHQSRDPAEWQSRS
jgi:plasmid stabilization system protein ParE